MGAQVTVCPTAATNFENAALLRWGYSERREAEVFIYLDGKVLCAFRKVTRHISKYVFVSGIGGLSDGPGRNHVSEIPGKNGNIYATARVTGIIGGPSLWLS